MVSMQLGHQTFAKQAKKKWYIVISLMSVLALCCFFVSCSLIFSPEDTPIYLIGQDARWRDVDLKGKERNLAAFNHELMISLAKEEKIRIRLTSSSDLVKELQKGELQGILTTIRPSFSNENFLFSDPYFRFGPVLIVRSSEDLQDEKGRGKKIIAITEHSPLLSSLEQDPTIQIRFYDDILMALADLGAKRIDGAIFPVIPSYTYTETFYKNEFKIATLPLTDEGIRLVTLKNKAGESLITKFNEGLKVLKENGAYHDMLLRWGFIDVEQIVP